MGRVGKNKISVFAFDDYRKFLKAWYESAKKVHSSFSYRAFSKNAGFNSSNFFMLVMQGKRNLTEESIGKMIKGLELNKQEKEFFRNLVLFNQAKRHEDKDVHYQRLLKSKKFRQLKPIEKVQYEYYSNWYHPVVRELVVAKDFDGTSSWIADHISPPITDVQAEKSIELLERLGFIEKDENGKWKQTSTILSTGPVVQSIVVHNYHKSILDLSRLLMDDLGGMGDRDVSSLTLGVTKDQVDEINNRIRAFRKDIMEMVSNVKEPEEVLQLNIQLYPVTKGDEGRDHE
ncbi:MAG: TIGR02147 family protein [Deltaproteobacteria bacterium]|jgi:uncharacterized protein (TIGR02147 family)|nr:TIGR02147 family protein [Deltaproteobacteria bacterium]